MSYYDEIENIAYSIEQKNKRQYLIRNIFLLFSILGLIFFIYNLIEYPEDTKMPTLNIIITLLWLIPLAGLTFMDSNSIEKRVFKNMKELIFFYLFFSWKNHNNETSKNHLKKCINKIKLYSYNYKKLAYTEEIYSAFDEIQDVLTHHIYPALDVRKDIKDKNELISQTTAWDKYRDFSIEVYQNNSIKSINEKMSEIKNHFERNDNIKIYEENQLTNFFKTFISWNIKLYRDSLTYRFIFYVLITIVIDYFLIIKNFDNDVVLSATILIPIMAPYYLAPKR